MTTTIAAISTPLGYGGISIIRMSGPDSFNIAEKIFKRFTGKSFESQGNNTIHYGHVFDKNGEVIDEVLISKMRAPHTFTTEDTVEINCHGGLVAANEVLLRCIELGCVLAEPGEFTKRAFLGGRIDLIEAQAISDIIEAKTTLALKASQRVLSGELSKMITDIREKILDLDVKLEVTIEYPEYDVDELTDSEIRENLVVIRDMLTKMNDSCSKGDILRQGLKIAISGKPNVGKSTLLNAIVGSDKAIVTDIPGTTRDIVDETVNFAGVPFILMDTAGIRENADVVEAIGVKRSLEAIDNADIVLFVCDSSRDIEDEDLMIYSKVKDTKHILIINKTDIRKLYTDSILSKLGAKDDAIVCEISADKKLNIDDLEMKLKELSGIMNDSVESIFMANARLKDLSNKAIMAVDNAIKLIDDGMPVDFISTDIMECSECLASILGQDMGDEVINEIFKRFCLGK